MHHPRTAIAGAGLSGLATAIRLAQLDWPAGLFDSAPDSGWERKEAWDAIENWSTACDFPAQLDHWKISRAFECRPIHQFEVFDSRGDCHPVTSSRPIFYLVKRGCQPGALEYALKQQALESGVTFQYNQRRVPQEVDVWAVGAQHRGQFLGAGLRFRTRHPDTVRLLISASHAPRAYAYLFIVDGKGTLSVTLTRDFASARAYLCRSLEFFSRVSPLDMQDVRPTAGFGGRRSEFRLKLPGPLCVGEAAGLQDYLWGFGIRYALHSGFLAAQAIAKGTDYDQELRRQIFPQVYDSLLKRALYNRTGDRGYRWLIGVFSKSSRLVDLLGGRYCPSIPALLHNLLQRVQQTSFSKESEHENMVR